MSNQKQTKPQELNEETLEAVAGGGDSRWIEVQSFSQSLHKPGGGATSDVVPTESFSFNYTPIK